MNELQNYYKWGDDYYNSRNTAILEREKKVYIEGIGVTTNPYGSNHKLPSGHFKKIVDQKVGYSLGKGVVFEEKQDLDKYFKESFDETLLTVGTEASKKGGSWLYAYKENGQLKFISIPIEQLEPEYDEFDNLVKMIRKYEQGEWLYRNEYDAQEVRVYRKKLEDKSYKLYKVCGHWSEYEVFNGQLVGEPLQHGFGEVPFIPLWNNRDHLSDLYNIKNLIDVYDIINSDFANNIDDMQEAFLTLKNYSGDAKNMGEFLKQLKMYKAVPVGDGGDVGVNQLDVPVEARKTFLEILSKDIYKFAMAVDLTSIDGGTITNVYIKAMFSDLDLKADQFESEVRKFIYRIIDFVNKHDNKSISKEINFDRNMIINRQEVIESLIKLSGILSQKTLLRLLPYDIDVEEELKLLEEENSGVTLDEPNQSR